MRTTTRAVLLTLLVAFGALACSSSDSGIEGTYEHEEEGTIVIEGDGKAEFTQAGETIALTYTRDGDNITLTSEEGDAAKATVSDGKLTFEPGTFSQDGEVVFTKK